jgi:hypothetical protein
MGFNPLDSKGKNDQRAIKQLLKEKTNQEK